MPAYRLYLIATIVAGLGAVQVARAITPATPAEAITQRENGMKQNGRYFFPLAKQLPNAKSVTQYTDGAKQIAAFARELPTLFPPGSETGQKTRAKPDVWAQPALFKQDADKLAVQADKLAELAAANDSAGFIAQYKVVGAACDTCHNKFRVPAD